jgi:hypothetical protein
MSAVCRQAILTQLDSIHRIDCSPCVPYLLKKGNRDMIEAPPSSAMDDQTPAQSGPSQGTRAPLAVLEALNTVQVNAMQIAAASHVLARAGDGTRQLKAGEQLQKLARRLDLKPHGLAGHALHARLIALENWRGGDRPAGEDRKAPLEAAARAPLVQTEEGIGFEPVAFGELVEFIEEMPF